MMEIREKTLFEAPLQTVFDAERNIDLHSATQGNRGEKAVAGVTSGLIEKGEEVEWEAVHFGLKQRLRTRIVEMEKPDYFRTEQVFGAFKTFTHDHRFQDLGGGRTEKTDLMRIDAPFGLLGRLAEKLFLERYMRRFLKEKNAGLKALVERKA
jgi:ligand-binding SRPBCC domain-containing protein